jgi:acyl-CoA dehydrogenase
LCLKAAWMMDTAGVRAAQPWISKIKVQAPLMALKVVDDAMQVFGATGISQDTPLAAIWTDLRTLRFADGPDAVHRRQVARAELRKHTQRGAMSLDPGRRCRPGWRGGTGCATD